MTELQVSLQAYLERVEYAGDLAATAATLHGLHLAHATHIPFENIDVLLGRGIELDAAALERKLIAGRRGGYCFEQNLLFHNVLCQLGFTVTCLSARVRFGAVGIRPRTHMLLLVEAAGTRWIADVGFGHGGLLLPVPFDSRTESKQFLWAYRVVAEGAWWIMQSHRDGAWTDLYAFTLDAHERVDYDVLNHYTATHPRSVFRSRLIAHRASTDRRVLLRNQELTIETAEGVERRTVPDTGLVGVLRQTFGIELPPDIRLEVPNS